MILFKDWPIRLLIDKNWSSIGIEETVEVVFSFEALSVVELAIAMVELVVEVVEVAVISQKLFSASCRKSLAFSKELTAKLRYFSSSLMPLKFIFLVF